MGPILELALDAVWRAGKVTLSHFQTGVRVEKKEDESPVTIADREAEKTMRSVIEARFPNDGIVGEEFGEERPSAPRRWILDPIDGTKSFIHGVPLYGVLLAVEEAGEVRVGVAHFPALQETIWAAKGLGCHLNGRRVRVSDVRRLDEALVLTSDAEDIERSEKAEGWNRLRKAARLVRTWGDAYGYALVASGRAEVMLDARFSLWDAAAVRPIIEEAGGVFSDWQGNVTHQNGSGVATNAALADAVRQLLVG
jgi:histidinol phosphatase-like enzyme (inositol monophosphatase family)